MLHRLIRRFIIKMPNIKTAERILELLKKENKPITPTNIHKKIGVEYGSVLSSIKSLENFQQVKTISDGRIILVSLKANDMGDKTCQQQEI